MSIISNLIRKTKKKTGPLNILTFFYDGKFDIELLQTGHEFYGYLQQSAYQWPGYKNAMYRNLHILQEDNEFNNIDFDLVLFNSRHAHHQFFPIAKQLHLPALIIDHDVNLQNAFMRSKNKQFTPFPHISTSEVVKAQYEAENYINYGIDKKNWAYEKDIDILCTVSNQHDLSLVMEIKRQFPSSVFIGHNPNVPFAGLVETYEDYKNLFKRSRVFVNISPQLNLNYDILFALNNSVPIITQKNKVYDGLLEEGINSIQVGSQEELISKIKELSFNKALYNKISNFSTNLDGFSQDNFLTRWNDVFTQNASRIYIE